MFICAQCSKEHAVDTGAPCTTCGGPLVAVRDEPDSLVGRVLGGKYVLLKQLGEGGMGAVYSARRRDLDTIVAAKLLRLTAQDRSAALKRFYMEAKNSSKLKHPHNIRIFDFGHTEDGMVFLIMELVDGVPLSQVDLPLEPKRAIRLITQICGALSEAHELGLVHRDLKPANIMVGEVDGKDFARVLDYGIAKYEDSSTGLTATGSIIGTPEYISPEQVGGGSVDRRVDVYALGLILYELLVGRPPFQADSAIALAYMHRHETPPPPSAFGPIAPSVEGLILECLVKERDERIEDVRTLRMRLEDLVDTGQIEPTGGHQPVVIPGGSGPSETVEARWHATPEPAGMGHEELDTTLNMLPAMVSRRMLWAALIATVALALVVLAFILNGSNGEPEPSDSEQAAEGSSVAEDQPVAAANPETEQPTGPPTTPSEQAEVDDPPQDLHRVNAVVVRASMSLLEAIEPARARSEPAGARMNAVAQAKTGRESALVVAEARANQTAQELLAENERERRAEARRAEERRRRREREAEQEDHEVAETGPDDDTTEEQPSDESDDMLERLRSGTRSMIE